MCSPNMDEYCPRLLDYVVFVGSLSTNRYGSSVQSPIILNRFPPCDHEDFILPPDIAMFCQPEGCYNVNRSRLSKTTSGRSPVSFVFTLTDKESGKIRYGISLNFFRPIQRGVDLRQQESDFSASLQCDTSCVTGSQESLPDTTEMERHSPLPCSFSMYTHTLTSLCIVTHHPFFAKFRWILDFLHMLIQKCNEKSHLKSPTSETVWETLTGAVRSVSSPVVTRCVREIETWIIRLLSAPAPIPGKSCVQVYVQPKSLMRPLVFAMPDKSRLPLADFPVHLPIQLLGIARTLRILVCLLLEQKVVIQSADYNKVSLCVLAFTALLYPLQYMFPVIPLLPPCMPDAEQLLIAPTPYIIGVPTSFYTARKIFRMPKDVWLANLDTQELSYPEVLDEIPDMPETECNNLVRQIQCILDTLKAAKSSSSVDTMNNASQSASSAQIVGYNPLDYITDEASASMAIRVAMTCFLTSKNILGGLTEHTRTLRLYPRPVVAFQFENFMKSRPRLCLFTSMLGRTQAVEYFAESTLSSQNDAYQRIEAGHFAPELIGDQPQWFADSLPSVAFDVWPDRLTDEDFKPGSSTDFTAHPLLTALILARLHSEFSKEGALVHVQTLVSSGQKSDASECPTDQSGSDTETELSSNSIRSTISDLTSEQVDSGIGADSLHKSTSSQSGTRCDATDVVLLESVLVYPGKPLPPCLAVHFNPPTEPVLPPPAAATPSVPNGCANGIELSHLDDQSLTADNPSPSQSSKATMRPSTGTLFGLDKASKSNLTSAVNGENDWMSFARFGEWFNLTATRFLESADINPNGKGFKKRIEDERYLLQLAKSIKSGNIPGIFSRNRLPTLFAVENYRNLVLSRLMNVTTGTVIDDTQQHVEDVPVDSWNQYKALVWLLRRLISGLEVSMCWHISIPTPANLYADPTVTHSTVGTDSIGGLASAFTLLEIAHTHCYLLPSRKSDRYGSLYLRDSARSSLASLSIASEPVSPRPSSSDVLNKDASNHLDDTTSKSSVEDPIRSPVSEQNGVALSPKTIRIVRLDRPTSSPKIINITPSTPLDASTPRMGLPNGTSDESPPTADKAQADTALNLLPKSSRTLGYRYHGSKLVRTVLLDAPGNWNSLTPKRHSFGSTDPYNAMRRVRTGRTYVFEDLVSGSDVRSKLWDDLQFWEDAFLDAVSQERAFLGMDFRPVELLERYAEASPVKRKHAELEEDRLLASLMHNLVSFMLMTDVHLVDIRRKIRRLLAKSHMGLHYSQEIGNLLDALDQLSGNDIDLKPMQSRLTTQRSYEVFRGTSEKGELLFIEVCDDYLLLRNLSGRIIDRWWFDQLVNIHYRLHSHVLCISTRTGQQSGLHLFYTKKCQLLYEEIQQAMKRVPHHFHHGSLGGDLKGELNVIDQETGTMGTIRISLEGFSFNFPHEKVTIKIHHVKRCSVPQSDIFTIEYYDRSNRVVRTRKFRTDLASNLLYHFHILISSISTLVTSTRPSSSSAS